MYNKRNLLVTGGAGFIGSAFVAKAVARGDNVIVLDALTYAGHKENLEWITGAGSYQLVVGDITDGTLIAKLLADHAIDAVINFAAESHVDNSIHSPAVFIETNIIGAYRMLEASLAYYNGLSGSKKQHFRHIQISTDEVYGTLGETGKFDEETAMRPNSPYSASKAAGDHLARAWYETYGLPTLVTNCSNNYGPRQFPEKLIPRMITCALTESPLPIYGDGKNIRDWIHVEDHSDGIFLSLEQGTPGETYCFGGNAERTNIELVATLCGLLDQMQPRRNGQSYNALITMVKDRRGHDRRYAIDDSKAVKELGFTRRYNFEQGLESTISWYLNNIEWCRKVVISG